MKKINENTKITLTIGQLKKLVKESFGYEDEEFQQAIQDLKWDVDIAEWIWDNKDFNEFGCSKSLLFADDVVGTPSYDYWVGGFKKFLTANGITDSRVQDNFIECIRYWWNVEYADPDEFDDIRDMPRKHEVLLKEWGKGLHVKDDEPDEVEVMEGGGYRHFTQRELRQMVRAGEAIDITDYSLDQAREIRQRGYDIVGVCTGVYGLTGALLKMTDTGDFCAVISRNTILSYLV